MRSLSGLGVASLGVVLSLSACQPVKEGYGPPSTCDEGCVGPPPTGNTPGTDGGTGGGGVGGAASTIDQSGTLHRIVSSGFNDTATAPYTGLANVIAYPDQGEMATVPYGSGAFSFTGIPGVPTWFFAQDGSSGAAGVMSTFSRFNLPVATNLALPLVDLDNLTNIVTSLPSGGTLGQGANVILFITHLNAAYKGVQVTGGAGGGLLAYDSGAGYTDTAGGATGTRGVILLLSSALSGPSTITLTDQATLMTYDVIVQTAPGAATIAGFEIP